MPKGFDHTKAIFTFGSNLGGFHGAGAAKFALNHKGAILRQAEGLQGQSYAIPTKDASIRNTLSLPVIEGYVKTFLTFAKVYPELHFQVTRIGCGLAGLKDHDIAPMFDNAPDNCWFDAVWGMHIGIRPDRIWGSF